MFCIQLPQLCSVLRREYRSTPPKVLQYSAESTGVLCREYYSTFPEVQALCLQAGKENTSERQ